MWIETNARIFSASSLSVMFLLDKMFFFGVSLGNGDGENSYLGIRDGSFLSPEGRRKGGFRLLAI